MLSPKTAYKLFIVQDKDLYDIANLYDCKNTYVLKQVIIFKRRSKDINRYKKCKKCVWYYKSGNYCPFSNCFRVRED